MNAHARTEDPTEVAARALVHLRRVYHAIHSQSSSIESALGVTSPQLWALHAIVGEPRGLTLGAVAEKLVLHKANAGRLVEKLVQKKLVECETPERDRRLVIVRATTKGRALLEKKAPQPVQVELLDRLSALPPRELATIERALEKLVALARAEEIDPGHIVEGPKRGR
jgi:DNA-binding MarR family transcriptional regulator